MLNHFHVYVLRDSSKASTEANHITKKERSEKVKSPATVKKTPRDGKRKDEKQIQERASKDERRKDELQEVSTHQQTEGVSLTTKKKKKKKKKKRKKKSLDQGESKEKRKDNRRSKEEAADSRELVRLKCQEMLADALKSDGKRVLSAKSKTVRKHFTPYAVLLFCLCPGSLSH